MITTFTTEVSGEPGPGQDLVAGAFEGVDDGASSLLDSALGYAAINIALRHIDPIGATFPDAMRLTMHPKPGQIGMHRFGSVFPWNGVASARYVSNPDSITIEPLYQLYATGASWAPLYDNRWAPAEILGFELVSD